MTIMVTDCKHLCLWLAMDNLVSLFLELQHKFSENSVYMNSIRPLTILILLVFCMKFISGVGVT